MTHSRVSFARFFVSIVFAFFMTAGLILLMQHLIKPDAEAPLDPDQSIPISYLPVIEEPPPPPPQLPEPVEPPSPPPPTHILPTVDGDGPILVVFNPEPVVDPKVGVDQHIGGDALPILTVPPDYPDRALARGIEGFVVVEFTITAAGTIADAVVVRAHPPGIFEQSALRAIARYKYKPRVLGVARSP